MGLLSMIGSFLSMILLNPEEPKPSTDPEMQTHPQNFPNNTVPSRPETDMPAYQYQNSWNDQTYGYQQQQHPQHSFGQQQNLVGGILKVFHSSHTKINWVDLNTSRAWQTKRIRRKNFLIQFGGHHNFV